MLHLLQTAALISAGLLLAAAPIGSARDADQAQAGLLVVQAGLGGSVSSEEGRDGMVTLQAVPQRGHFFSAWRCVEGLDCPDGAEGRRMASIQFLPQGAIGLAAEFGAEPVQASLTILQANGGTVVSECGAVCTRSEGTPVQVQAVPNQGRRFSGWDCQGGAACLGFNRANPAPLLHLSGSAVLTPRYASDAGGFAAIRSVEGGSWRLAAECGAACAAGEGWNATATAAAGSGHVFRNWGCAEGAACPQEALQARSAELRLGVEGRLALAPQFGQFRVFSPDLIDFFSTSRRVEQQAICNIQGECLYTISNGSTRLSVDTPEAGQRTYHWSLMPENPHLSLGNQAGNSIDLIAEDTLDDIITVVVEVNSPQTEADGAGRDTLMVVVVPAGLAVNVDDRCSGFVASQGGRHFVVTAAHCLTDYSIELDATVVNDEVDIKIGPQSSPMRLTGQVAGLDELTDVGVIRIPNPGLRWIPEVGTGKFIHGEPVQVVGYPVTADFVGETPPQLSVTAAMATLTDEKCEYQFPGHASFAVGGLPSDCDAEYIEVVPDASSPRGSGGPVLNSDKQVAAIVSAGSVRNSEQVTRAAVIGEQLERLFNGGMRCLEDFVVEEMTFPDGVFEIPVDTIFNDCSVE